jgi:anti-sigma factor RsiW
MHPTSDEINEYVDGSLNPSDHAAVDEHVTACTMCRALVGDMRDLRRLAGEMGTLDPPAGGWARIQRSLVANPHSSADSRLSTLPRRPSTDDRRLTTGDWRLATVLVAAALIVISTVVGVRTGLFGARGGSQPSAAGRASTVPSIQEEQRQVEQHYQQAISGLEQIAQGGQGVLDPATAATLEKNLAVVDQAISESRAALRAEPDSEPAEQTLLDSFKAKLTLLQDTIALINEMRKGDDVGAARIVSGIQRGS